MNAEQLRRGASDVLGALADACKRLEPGLRTMKQGLDGVKAATARRQRPAAAPASAPTDLDMERADRALRRHGIGL